MSVLSRASQSALDYPNGHLGTVRTLLLRFESDMAVRAKFRHLFVVVGKKAFK